MVTVLFSDLRNFTALSERRSAHDTVSLLNTYFTQMSAAIEAHGGVVDKYLGDGIMALFGAPVESEDHAGNAVMAALAMQSALVRMNRDLAARGMPPLTMGIGINSGVAVAGNLGSPERLNYTVIGDSVNLAARLEGLTKRLGGDEAIVISAETLKLSRRNFRVRPLGARAVRGKADPVEVYAVLGTADAGAAGRPAA
jgi:adenylate cyclase